MVWITLLTSLLSIFKPLEIQPQIYLYFFFWYMGQVTEPICILLEMLFVSRLQAALKVFCHWCCKIFFLLTCLCFFPVNADIIKFLQKGRAQKRCRMPFLLTKKAFFLEGKVAYLDNFSSTKKQVIVFPSHLSNFVSLAFITEMSITWMSQATTH